MKDPVSVTPFALSINNNKRITVRKDFYRIIYSSTQIQNKFKLQNIQMGSNQSLLALRGLKVEKKNLNTSVLK